MIRLRPQDIDQVLADDFDCPTNSIAAQAFLNTQEAYSFEASSSLEICSKSLKAVSQTDNALCGSRRRIFALCINSSTFSTFSTSFISFPFRPSISLPFLSSYIFLRLLYIFCKISQPIADAIRIRGWAYEDLPLSNIREGSSSYFPKRLSIVLRASSILPLSKRALHCRVARPIISLRSSDVLDITLFLLFKSFDCFRVCGILRHTSHR